MISILQDTRSIFQCLGNLLKKPELLIETQVQLQISDFPQRFHKLIFGAIKQLFKSGLREIDSVSIDCFLAGYKDQYKIFEQNNGLEYLNDAIELSNLDGYEYHLKRIKKFSLLRNLQDQGFNILEVYDETNENKLEEFDKLEIDEILNHYNKKLIEIERNFVDVEIGTHIADGIDELLDDLETNPIMGYDCGINALNYYLFGLRKKFYLFSAGTGLGKTRIQAYFSLQLGYHQKVPNVFISTELPKDEIQTMMISYLANISERKLLNNNLTYEERKRRDEAKQKLKESCIYIVYIPDFTLEKIEHTIKRFILSKKVEYVFFDYIKESISMLEGIGKKVGKVDGWKALKLFSERLKMLVEKYKVGIMTATQINKEGNAAGSFDIPNAVDVWCKVRLATEEEIEKYDLGFSKTNEDEEITIIDNRKNRRGLKEFKVFLLTDLGKLNYKELLVTKGKNIIKVPVVKFKDKE